MKPYEPEKIYHLWVIHFHTLWNDNPIPQRITIQAVHENEAVNRAVSRLNCVFGKNEYVIDGWEMKENE